MIKRIKSLFFLCVFFFPFILYSQNQENQDLSYSDLSIGYYKDMKNNDLQFANIGFSVNNKINKFITFNSMGDLNIALNDSSKYAIFVNFSPALRLFTGNKDGFNIYYEIGAGFSLTDDKTIGLNSFLNIGIGYSKYSIYFSAKYIQFPDYPISIAGINFRYRL